MRQLEDVNKDCETKAEELNDMKDEFDKTNQDKKVLEGELNDVKDELAKTKGAFDKANHDKEVLEEELGTLKTSHEEEKGEYEARIAELETSLTFAKGKGERLELGVKMKKKLNDEKEGYVEDITRLQERLQEAEEAKRIYDVTFVSESQKIHNAIALVAAAKEGQAGDQLEEGGALLISVHNGFSERKQSKERCQREKTGLCGKNSQTEGGGLTQTHSIFFTAFSNSGAYKMA